MTDIGCRCLFRAIRNSACRDELVIPVLAGQIIPTALKEMAAKTTCTECEQIYLCIPYSTFDKRVTV